MLAVLVEGLGKRFGSQWVFQDLDLKVRQGQSLALFGGNGSGKTTLLKILATLVTPTQGSLHLWDEPIGLQKGPKGKIRNRLRFLGHEKGLYEILTVEENLSLTANLRGLFSKEGERALGYVLARLELQAVRAQRVGSLSEGMKKKVALARLLLGKTEPDLILLDEPYPTLDLRGQTLLDDILRDLKNKGKTIMIASHDRDRALVHADQVLHLGS